MTSVTLILRSLRFYWRTHLTVLAGVALTSAILTGALAVGDSVRHSLRQLALSRLGHITHAVLPSDRLFRSVLADETGTAPVLLLTGTVTFPDGSARANDVQVVGVDERFWRLGSVTNFTGIVVNERLAVQLGVRVGDTIVVRVEQPALLSRDATLSGKSDATVALRVPVAAIAGDSEFGRFSLHAEQVSPRTVFVPLALLQQELKRPGQANALLVDSRTGVSPVTGGNGGETGETPVPLKTHWTLEDAGLELRSNQLQSAQVFIEPAVATAALGVSSNAVGVLTYFVNEIRCGEKSTPYSFVTATGGEAGITINSWLADDLGATIGSELVLRYFVMGDRRELLEQAAQFRVARIVPVEKDESWMPAFPGLADAGNCRAWEPGIPIALDRIRPKDEAYWKQYRGTPKAFIALPAGQKLWSNRFGNLTAIRFPIPVEGEPPACADEAVSARRRPGAPRTRLAGRLALQTALESKLEPPAFVPVRAQALRASADAQDFGQLFIGFSLFLIVAALLLTGLLLAFNLEQRQAEIGLLRAIGFSPGQVWRLVLVENLIIALVGTLLGVAGGVIDTKLTLLGLATVWRGAVGATQFRYHAEPITLGIGVAASLLAALGALILVQRHQTRRAPIELISAGRLSAKGTYGKARNSVPCLALLGAVLSLRVGSAGGFFGAGACLLIAGIWFSGWWLRRLEGMAVSLGLRNATRQRGRKLTTIGVLASGVFLLVAVNAFHQDAKRMPHDRRSGTGGFAFYAESALPVYEPLAGAAAVALRLREGDDASCRNLNRAQQPRLLGVRPAELAKRGAFGLSSSGGLGTARPTTGQVGRGVPPRRAQGWDLLNEPQPDGAVPAIGDEATVVWALGKKVGDRLAYPDGHGRTFQIRIVGLIPNSILQGSLVIAEKNFVEHFPDCGGYRVFLIDTLPADLARTLENRGFAVVPAWRRLAEFLEVENTYMAIFQALGGLGLLLGSSGLAIVVLRNTLERRSELALLQAVGFRRNTLRWLVVTEHWLVVALAMAVGLGAALVAVGPAQGGSLPVLTLIALAVGGLAWCWLAAWATLRGPLLPALRNE